MRFPSLSGNVVMREQLDKSSAVKEVRFPSSSGHVIKLLHRDEPWCIKEVKLPTPSRNASSNPNLLYIKNFQRMHFPQLIRKLLKVTIYKYSLQLT